MNQVAPNFPVTLAAGTGTIDHVLECAQQEAIPFQGLATEIQSLRAEIDQLANQNEELKQSIDSIYASPTEKRQLLSQLERKYGISRRRACRLLTFARSTCWYRSSTVPRFSNAEEIEINTLSSSALVQRLKKLARQAENGFLPLDANLQSQFEYGLNRIGLHSAAHLSQSNLKLAMEIFTAWCEQPSLQ